MGRLTELNEYDYSLPKESIAQTPIRPRDQCRLMVLDRRTGKIEHIKFTDIVGLLRPGDLMVINDTKVIRAKLSGRKVESGGKVEVLLLRRLASRKDSGEVWETIAKPGRRLGEGIEVVFSNNNPLRLPQRKNSFFLGRVLSREGGKFIFRFDGKEDFIESLEKIGEVPLPPYIARSSEDKIKFPDSIWYQTVYAREEGAIAAPTAGLHFTRRLLRKIEERGVKVVPLTLHIGWGTFKPVRTAEITKHRLDAEYFELNLATAEAVNKAKEDGKRIIAVGTSTARALESCCIEENQASLSTRSRGRMTVEPQTGWTELFIYPGYEFRVVDALITNFHLPKSTLLMLVVAFGGKEKILEAYREAIKEKYRFYSYGDAMFIV